MLPESSKIIKRVTYINTDEYIKLMILFPMAQRAPLSPTYTMYITLVSLFEYLPHRVSRPLMVFIAFVRVKRVDGAAHISVVGRREVGHRATGQAQGARHCRGSCIRDTHSMEDTVWSARDRAGPGQKTLWYKGTIMGDKNQMCSHSLSRQTVQQKEQFQGDLDPRLIQVHSNMVFNNKPNLYLVTIRAPTARAKKTCLIFWEVLKNNKKNTLTKLTAFSPDLYFFLLFFPDCLQKKVHLPWFENVTWFPFPDWTWLPWR